MSAYIYLSLADPVIVTPNRVLLLEGPGKLDPAARAVGFERAGMVWRVPYFAGCLRPLCDCAADLEAGTGRGFTAEGAVATNIRRGPLFVEFDWSMQAGALTFVPEFSFGPSEIGTRRGPSVDVGTLLIA